MSHLPSLHLGMTATRERCHRNHNLKKGGTTFKIRARWGGERQRNKHKYMTYGMYKITEAKGKAGTKKGKLTLYFVDGDGESIRWVLQSLRTFCNHKALHAKGPIYYNAPWISAASASARPQLDVHMWNLKKALEHLPSSRARSKLETQKYVQLFNRFTSQFGHSKRNIIGSKMAAESEDSNSSQSVMIYWTAVGKAEDELFLE